MEASQTAPVQRLAHFGNGGELFAITLINLLLKVVTLGIYHFWGKTRVRKYVWSHTRFAGEQFEYVGRGGELMRGYMIAMVIFVPAVSAWQFLIEFYADRPLIVVPVTFAGYAGFIFFSGLALFSSRRYLLSRTRWRGVRLGVSGSALRHGKKMLLYSFVVALTAGIYFPFMRSNLYAHLAGNSWVGDRQLAYAGRGRGLLAPFIWFALLNIFIFGLIVFVGMGLVQSMAIAQDGGELSVESPWLLILVAVVGYGAVGINWLWYRAHEFRYLSENTTVDGVALSTDFSTGSFIWLWTGNILLLLLTLGLAYAWVVVRTTRFFSDHIHLEGELELASIKQTAQQVPSSGEGLAEALDMGGI